MSAQNTKNNKRKIIAAVISCIILIIIASILLMSYIRYNNRLELTQLGNMTTRQMMGYFLKTKDNKNIVIDGGTTEDSQNLIDYINQNGGEVDTWFITHPHEDHVGAIIEILNNTQIPIHNIYVTLNTSEWYEAYGDGRGNEAQELIQALEVDRVKDKVKEVELGQEIQVDNITFKILGVKNPEITENAMNNSSMVIKCMVNDKSIIFLGDTGIESGEKLLKNQREELKADYVQVAHHGQAGAGEELYKAISPKVAMWPTPDWLWNNDSGEGEDSGTWKTKETRAWLENIGVKENIIEKDGNITIKIY